MNKSPKTTPVRGGSVTRDPESGRFIEVRTSKGVAKADPRSEASVAKASSKRGSALRRLADR
jgi:hypothetical protein